MQWENGYKLELGVPKEDLSLPGIQDNMPEKEDIWSLYMPKWIRDDPCH